MTTNIQANFSRSLLINDSNKALLRSQHYLDYQLERIRPQIKILGNLATFILLLMLPWDFWADTDDRNLAMVLRMVAVLQLYLIVVFWQSRWLEKHFVSSLMILGFISFLGLCGNYLLIEDRTPYIYTILFYYNLGFLVLAPLASTLQILLTFFVPSIVMYSMLYYIGALQTYILPFALNALPLLLILNIAAWYVRKSALRTFKLYTDNIQLATTDPLSGLLNRRAWDAQSASLLARARREKFTFAVLITDIDHFKKVNDNWGHQVGDQVIQAVAKCLSSTMREYDVIGRYGGEEFIASILGLNHEQLANVGERLRQSLENLEVSLATGEKIKVTASVGIACRDDAEMVLEDLVKASDNALYRAKHKGRNRVEMDCC